MTQQEAINLVVATNAVTLQHEYYIDRTKAQAMAEAMSRLTGEVWVVELTKSEFIKDNPVDQFWVTTKP